MLNLSARLPYMLNTSRFAHYIKMIMRDKIGSLMSKSDTQSYLQTWIAQYVLLSDIATQETKHISFARSKNRCYQ